MALRPTFPPPKCPHTPPEEEVSNSDDEIAACLGRVAHWGASVLQEKAPLGRGLKSRRFTRTNSKRVSLLWPFHGRPAASGAKFWLGLLTCGRGTSAGRQFWPRGIVPRHSPVWRQTERKSPGLLRPGLRGASLRLVKSPASAATS